MKRNVLGGKKYKKKKKFTGLKERTLETAETGQIYGKIYRKLGGEFMEVMCTDGILRKGMIRGKMRKREWLNVEDIVLCTLGTFGDDIRNMDKCTIEIKYRPDEIDTLKSKGLLNFKNNDDMKGDIFDEGIEYEIMTTDTNITKNTDNDESQNDPNIDINKLIDML